MICVEREAPTYKKEFLSESEIASIEPFTDKRMIVYFKDGTYKKIDKITFE